MSKLISVEEYAIYIYNIEITDDKPNKNCNLLKYKLSEYKNSDTKIIKFRPTNYDMDNEIWKLFDKLYDIIDNEETIYLKLSNKDNLIPILVITIINYLKVVKNIKIGCISYEDSKSNLKPVFDITSLDIILSWTKAIDKFVHNGDSKEIHELAEKRGNMISKISHGENKYGSYLRSFGNNIENFTEHIQSSRGYEIDTFQYDKLKYYIEEVKLGSPLPPMKPLLDMILDKIEDFSTENLYNGLNAVKWCIDNNLTQQGYTLLRENIINIIIYQIVYHLDIENFTIEDLKNSNIREAIEDALIYKFIMEHNLENNRDTEVYTFIKYVNDGENNIKNDIKNNIVYKLDVKEISKSIDSKICNIYKSVSDLRNDINHAGYKINHIQNPQKFKDNLERHYIQLLDYIYNTNNTKRNK
ncbi:TM1812 family CRISPR-associated protein [Methanococcus voltae]|uniref:CRISPR-associated protein TM1812 n=1 Tax=Methanococcus voltae (strain ATCC BAA-1334 / A3) TaxID=456320 RepID=D7DTR4_METV3|nr:TM1812 family CRISPR-associated protein [Methanococcus voltae]MCS3901378.1 hypothetical protein [Methanococcus voltae]